MHDPVVLATKIIKRISLERDCTYDDLEARANEKGIDTAIFLTAMTMVHRNRTVVATKAGGGIHYAIKKIEIKPIASHLVWLRENYPPMTSENDGSGIDVDFSWLFLKPEQLDEYKAAARGVAYIPKQRGVRHRM